LSVVWLGGAIAHCIAALLRAPVSAA